jgi:aryl-alcohol dehydrogenase-like predicted oxidoreductase
VTLRSHLGIGGWPLGGGATFTRSGPDDAARVTTLRRALESGFRWVDLAPLYGFGHAERLVGRLIRSLPEAPEVFTKCGFVWDARGRVKQTLRRESVRREIDESLRRLGLGRLDTVQIHWPSPKDELEEGWHALAELKAEGKINRLGVCNCSVADIRRLTAIAPVEVIQIGYSLADRRAEAAVFPYCDTRPITVIAHSPLATGLFGGRMTTETVATLDAADHRRNERHFREPELGANLAVVDKLRALSLRIDVPVPALALAWVVGNRAVDGAIVGLRNRQQVDEAALTLTRLSGGSDIRSLIEEHLSINTTTRSLD